MIKLNGLNKTLKTSLLAGVLLGATGSLNGKAFIKR